METPLLKLILQLKDIRKKCNNSIFHDKYENVYIRTVTGIIEESGNYFKISKTWLKYTFN